MTLVVPDPPADAELMRRFRRGLPLLTATRIASN
jgi:hypothetical protein